MPAAVALVGVAGAAYAANKQSKAAKSAANTQAQASQDANRVQLQMFNQARADNEPFRQNALTAQQEYMALLGLGGQAAATPQPQAQGQTNVSGVFANNPFDQPRSQFNAFNPKLQGGDSVPSGFNPGGGTFFNGSTYQPLAPPNSAQTPAAPALTPQQSQQGAFDRFRNTPGYQFGLQTGFDQVQASAAAHGGLLSGKTLKALQKFGNDYADQQGYSPYMNRLASLAGMGQTVNAQNAQVGMNYANQAGANLINAGNARASGLLGQANAQSQLAGNIAGIGGWFLGQQGWGGI